MESKINYTVVGLFVILMGSGLIYFVYWLTKHGNEQEYNYYLVYMTESVAGLSPDASVKYRGVNVGVVDHIALNPEDPEQVELRLKIKQGVPIKQDTKATLKLFGLTGLAYIELAGGKKDSPLLASKGDKLPVIASEPSIFARIDESVTDLTGKSVLALDKFVKLLSDKNLQHFEGLLEESHLLVKEAREEMREFKELVHRGIVMEKHVTSAFKKVEKASHSVKNMSDTFKEKYADVGQELTEEVGQASNSFNQFIQQMNFLTNDLQTILKKFEESPADFIFKHTQTKPGPGEKGYDED